MPRRIVALLFLTVAWTIQSNAWKMEVDIIAINNTTGDVVTHIIFRQVYDDPPLVFSLMDDKGGDPSSLRINNITTTGFDIYTVEPDGVDGPHTNMSRVPYIAIELGDHTLSDGTKILAGRVNYYRIPV